MTTKKQAWKPWNGFAVEIKPDTNIGLAMLIAEDEEGNYEPVAVASTVNEAKELAQSDMNSRLRRLDRDENPGICPYSYKLWAQGIEGRYITIPVTIEAR